MIKRHAPIVLKSLFVSLFMMLFWRFVMHPLHLSFSAESENAILFIILTLSAFAYVIFAGYAVTTVLTEYKEISKAVVRNDVDTFLYYRDEQLPILVHLLVGTMSLFLLIFSLAFPYADLASGQAALFTITFIITLVYLVIIELDDYQNSIWFKEKIPREWYKINIEEHFRK